MTPKEKAKELFMDMKYHIPYVQDPTEPSEDKIAKQCALIAVDEILFSNNTIFETNIPHECWKYWIEVKQEIEKL
jgi:hypothetical protein